MENSISLAQLHKRHVKDTPHKIIVPDRTILLCNLTNAVVKAADGISPKVYVNTRVVKHLYDKKPAEEYGCIIKYMTDIVKYPSYIYVNKDAKRGDMCFVKSIQGTEYITSIEHRPDDDVCHVVTCFRLRKNTYLKGYNLLWTWKGGTPSS